MNPQLDSPALPAAGETAAHGPYARDAETMRLPRYFRLKRRLEWALALALLIPGLPLMGGLFLAIRCTSRGPALFRQRRVGQHGREFTMLKLRTMVVDAEAGTGPVWSAAGDPRVTWLGRIMRRLHLDELPQLFNVLRGEMALMGPRPERPEIAVHLAERIPGYARRLAVLPGITGLAQINLPPDTSLECVRRKLVLDLEYIHEASLLLDARMLACSLLRLTGLSGDRAMRVMRLAREPIVPETWRERDDETAAGGVWWVRTSKAEPTVAELPDASELAPPELSPALRALP